MPDGGNGGKPYIAVEDQSVELPDEVFKEEIKAIKERRKNAETSQSEISENVEISVENKLIGLALSGGGIRSATFSLGVLQAINKYGFFKYIDYLSTVSGGGFIGSCLSSAFKKVVKNSQRTPFPFIHAGGESEPDAFRHLRDNSNYLAPKEMFASLRLPGLLFRGVMTNFLIVLPFLLLSSVLSVSVHGAEIKDATSLSSLADFTWTKIIVLCYLLILALYPVAQFFLGKCKKSTWKQRDFFTRWLCGGTILLITIFIFIEVQPMAIYSFSKLDEGTSGNFIKFGSDFWTSAISFLTVILSIFSGKMAEKKSGLFGKAGLYLLGCLGPLTLWIIYLWLCSQAINADYKDFFNSKIDLLDYAFIAAIAIFAVTRLLYDVNKTSLNRFYRDRLSKAYLFDPWKKEDGQLEQNDEIKLSDLDSSISPYHLINTTLNIQKSKKANLRGRNGEFFLLSKEYVGSQLTGYCKTSIIENTDNYFNLGTAMAISGAAAAPNMGTNTVKSLTLIMTLLNIRLGYWLRNPFSFKSLFCD